MKLQINQKGSWRDVLSFDPELQAEVREPAAALLKICGNKKAIMRIATDENIRLAYCAGPDFVWRMA